MTKHASSPVTFVTYKRFAVLLRIKTHCGDFKIQRRGRQRERQKTERFNERNNNFLRFLHGLSFHFYADDSQLYSSFACNDTSDLVAAKQRLENCVADINLWMTANKLKLNNDKSEFLFLHSRFRHSLPPPNIMPPQQARNLGVLFDDTMSLSPHVNTIVKGGFYHIRNISKIRKYISTSTCLLYTSPSPRDGLLSRMPSSA